MSYGIKISKTGVDVKTAGNKDLALSSEQTCFKCEGPQSTTITVTGGEGTTTITHNLGFVPLVIAFINLSGSYYPMPNMTPNYQTSGFVSVTSTNFTLKLLTSDLPDGDYDAYYFISTGDKIV